jgi:transcriptional regulator with XRE-family HTH domain
MAVKLNKAAYEKARKRLGLTHREVAEQAGVTYATLWNWLNGKRNPASTKQDALCKALDVPPAKLFKLE